MQEQEKERGQEAARMQEQQRKRAQEQSRGQIQIEIKIDESYTQPKIVILTDRVTEEVSQLLQRLSEESPRMLAGFR